MLWKRFVLSILKWAVNSDNYWYTRLHTQVFKAYLLIYIYISRAIQFTFPLFFLLQFFLIQSKDQIQKKLWFSWCLRIIKALLLYWNSQYYVIVNLQNAFLSEKNCPRKKNIILQKSFQYIIVRYVTSDIYSSSYSNSINSRQNKVCIILYTCIM